MAPACCVGGGAARLPYNTALPALLPCLRSHSLFIKKINSNLVSPCYNQVDGRQQYIFQLLWPWSCRSKLKWRFIFFKVDFCIIFLQICFCVKINILKDSLIPRKSTIEIYIWKKEIVLATNSDFLIPISLQPDGVNLWYFKFTLFGLR